MVKRYACIAAAMTLTGLYAQPKVSLEPVDQSLAGLTVISPADQAFPDAVEVLVDPIDMPALKPILPYSVIIRNDTSRNLLGLCVVFRIVDKNGLPAGMVNTLSNFPTNRKPVLAPGKALLVSIEEDYALLSAGSPASPTPSRPLSFYNSARSIDVSFDSALFEDGTLVGPDKRDMFDEYSAELAAARGVAKAVLACQDHGGALALRKYLSSAVIKPSELQRRLRDYPSQFRTYSSDEARRFSRQLGRRGADAVFRSASAVLSDVKDVYVHAYNLPRLQ